MDEEIRMRDAYIDHPPPAPKKIKLKNIALKCQRRHLLIYSEILGGKKIISSDLRLNL